MSRNRKGFVLVVLLFVCALCPCLLGNAAGGTKGEWTSAQGACLMEAGSRRVLYAKNADAKLPMASTTKIMTALVVCENADLDEVMAVPREAVGVEGSSVYLRADEKLTVRELLYGLMLQSGNDCAVALALHVGGSIENFAAMMNRKAQEIGADRSHFVNPHGLHDDAHYTTAHDLALIACCALANDDFADIVSTKSVKIANEGYDYDRLIVNKNKLLKTYEYATGVKTGYTKRAGRCFVGSAKKDGMTLVAAVLNCGPMFENAKAMLECGFDTFALCNVVPQNKLCGAVCHNGKIRYYSCPSGFSFPLKKDGSEKTLLAKEVHLPDGEGDGEISVQFDGKTVFREKLVAN